jgi:hypothetical protein
MRRVLKNLCAKNPTVHPEIWSRWTDIVGVELARRTAPRALYGKTLHLAVASSAWMNELSFLKVMMIERLDEEVGPGVVREIRLILDPQMARPSTVPPPPPPPVSLENVPLPETIENAISNVADPTLKEFILKAARANIKT